ncbi:hypothetical protein ACGFMK_28870 [Amycolatopsis sp. NPDC049252]|uniref:hypothetical protein n=1 Tax=Amycolatopsis sp. NPDC049252 TaxID=3363933 RepID=UPI003719D9A6
MGIFTRKPAWTSRSYDRQPGEEFRDMVDLPGWEHQSIWGCEVGAFYAQLWRNDNRGDTPDLWLSGVRTAYSRPSCLVVEIVEIVEKKASLRQPRSTSSTGRAHAAPPSSGSSPSTTS